MYNKNNKEVGITLIALVITIIVLLILAGVSIASLTGNNGLLSKAVQAKKDEKNSTDLEEVKLAVTSGVTENLANQIEINKAIQDELRRTDNTATVTGDGDDKIIYYKEKEYNVNVKNGTIEVAEEPIHKKLSKLINETDYGKPINYSVEINGRTLDDWKIFYKDGGNVYIIYGGCLEASLIPSDDRVTKDTANNPYEVWPARGGEKFYNYLKDQSVWSEFATGHPDAIAVGAPSLEQLSLSYGRELETSVTKYYDQNDDDLYYNPNWGVGYWLIDYHKQGSSSFLIRFYKDGRIISSEVGSHDIGYSIRPVVCLPTNATGTKSSTIRLDKQPVQIEEETDDIPTVSTINYGNKTAKTVTLGDTITIGTYDTRLEKFLVINNDGTTIKAIPYYNITLDEENPIQRVITDNTIFSTSIISSPPLDMNSESIVVQKYISAYKNSLEKIGGFNINTRIPTRQDLESLTNEQRNPSLSRYYYVGSIIYYSTNKYYLYYVGRTGELSMDMYYYTKSNFNKGVRPLIEITIEE